MTLLIASILFFQAIFMYRVAGSWLFPPALYALYWAGVVACSAVIRFGDYSMSVGAMMVFLVGSIVFSIGGYVAVRFFGSGRSREPVSPARKRFIQNCIAVYSFGLLALVPLFISSLRQAGATLGIDEFAVAARTALGVSDRAGIPRYFQSVTSIGSVLAYCAAWLYDGARRDKITLVLATTATLAMSVLTFARTPVYMLIVGVLGILSFRKTIRPRTVFVSIALTLTLALFLGALLGKGPEFREGKSTAGAVVENLAVYFVGGPVGFGQIMGNPELVGEKGLSLRFFTQAAQSLGADIELPNNVLGYFSDVLGNVYTIYYAYWLDAGWWGIMLLALLAGFFCTSAFCLAKRNHPVAGAAMGLIMGSILNSATGDGIFGSSIPWLLLIFIVVFLWRVPLITYSRRCVGATA